ncbi:MAG: hypothetical protein OXG68_16435 [Chloroflexi bacterium]|nr:hypothetical protein [Chloroflexota bacterium]
MVRKILMLLIALSLAAASGAQEGELKLTWSPMWNTITGKVEVIGSANIPDQFYFYLEAAPWDPAEDAPAWQPVTSYVMSPVVDDVLGSWNTARFADGFYQLRLHALNSANESFHYALAPILINNEGDLVNLEPVEVVAMPGMEIAQVAPKLENRLPLQVGGHIKSFDDDTQAALRATGMTWVKKQVTYGISDGKDLIEAAHAQGYKVMLGALGDKNRLANDFDGYVADFAEYVAYLAELGADAIEVWNEPNIDREWPIGRVHGSNYTRLLKAAYEAIKAANPDTMVISGAPAPTGFFAGCAAQGCDDNVFMQQMANAGAANYADCIGVHYNEGILPPSSQGGDPRGEYQTYYLILMLRRVAWPFRNAGIPMCLTEVGYLSPEGFGRLPGHFGWAANTSVAEQAAWLSQALTIMSNFEDMPVELAVVWNIDFDHWGADPQAGYAIIRPDGSCPACESIAALQR